jgi:hypothetical protein
MRLGPLFGLRISAFFRISAFGFRISLHGAHGVMRPTNALGHCEFLPFTIAIY